MDIDRLRFVFGADEAPVDLDDETATIEWFEGQAGASPDEMGRAALHALVARQVFQNDPPQAWATAQRLIGSGLEPTEALDQMLVVMEEHLSLAIGDQSADDETQVESDTDQTTQQRLVAMYESLPLPEAGAIATLVLEHVGESGLSDFEQVADDVARRAGGNDAIPIVTNMVDAVIDAMVAGGELVLLGGGKLVNPQVLFGSITLTHVIEQAELDLGVLNCIGSDLAAFEHLISPRLASGEVLDVFSDDPDHLGWEGPQGWLGDFDAGDMVQVKCHDDVVQLEKIDMPDPGPDLVDALTDAMGLDPNEVQLPSRFDELVAKVVVQLPGAFESPAPPLTELCEKAGLEVRGGLVGASDESWDQLRRSRRFDRVFGSIGEPNLASNVLWTLDLLEDPNSTPAQLRECLKYLEDSTVSDKVLDELLNDDLTIGDASTAKAIGERLLGAATRPIDQAISHYVAGVVAERSGDVQAADRRFRTAIEHDNTFEPLVDRAAWYASLCGDAAAATRLWDSIDNVDPVEVATVAEHAEAADGDAQLGRNEPCWCGSGRKFKKCHLGQSDIAVLSNRVRWLASKATGYLVRLSGTATETVFELAIARAGSEEPELVRAAFDDPIVVDTALTEQGWFERFLDHYGVLLPDDELALAREWVGVSRSVFEVVTAEGRDGFKVRDLRTDASIDLREHPLSEDVEPGDFFCGRAIPDGESSQLIGAFFIVRAGTESNVLELCDRADGYELCRFLIGSKPMPQKPEPPVGQGIQSLQT